MGVTHLVSSHLCRLQLGMRSWPVEEACLTIMEVYTLPYIFLMPSSFTVCKFWANLFKSKCAVLSEWLLQVLYPPV